MSDEGTKNDAGTPDAPGDAAPKRSKKFAGPTKTVLNRTEEGV